MFTNSLPTKREWLMAVLVALFTIALIFVPYALGYLPTTDGRFFTGIVMNPQDSQTYFAKISQGYRGQFLYTIPFTPEAHEAALVGVFYVWLGQLARLTGLTVTAVWHLSRALAALTLFLTTFAFVSQFLADRLQRWTAYLLSIFGAGFGWVLFLLAQPYWLNHFPMDFKDPGAHLFFTALTYPHIILGTAFILISIWMTWQLGEWPTEQWQEARAKYSVIKFILLAGLVNTALGIAYPFLLYIILLVTALYWLHLTFQARKILWQKGILLASMFLIPAPLYLYYAYTLQINPVFKAWDVQAGTPSPPWPHYLVTYGLMLLLGFFYWRTFPQKRAKFVILWLWIIAVALLIYAPLNPQRRFVQGIQVPLSILTTAAFCQLILPRLQKTKIFQRLLTRPNYTTASLYRFITFLFILFMSLSNIYLWSDVVRIMLDTRPYPLFRPVDERDAADWLQANGEASAVLMGEYETGNYVAAHTPLHVMLGHWAETMAYEEKVDLVSQFYEATTSDSWRRDLIQQYHIRYVWHGPREQKLGDFDPETAVYLQPLYANPTISIYVVNLVP